ncbi:MAG: PIN domain-containing protein [Candidatus Bathyarchaeia archaeon]
MSAVIDTNVLIYDTFEDTLFHKEARTKLDELEKWYVPAMVIHEYVWFMKAEGINPSTAKDKTVEYLTHEKTVIVPDDTDGILFSIENLKNYRDYNDYVILAAAKGMGNPLLTFDRELREDASKIGINII